MGFFDSAPKKSSKSHKSSKRSKHRDESDPDSGARGEGRMSRRHTAVSSGDDDGYATKPDASESFFNVVKSSSSGSGSNDRSFFSTSRESKGRSPSYYKRSPRLKFLWRTYKKLKRLLRDLIFWAKKHPMKVFAFVIVPLLSSGGLPALLARFGLRLPVGIEKMLDIAAKTAGNTGSLGLMGEAMHMASTTGPVGKAIADRGYDSDLIYEKIRNEYAGEGSGEKGIMGLIGKFFS